MKNIYTLILATLFIGVSAVSAQNAPYRVTIEQKVESDTLFLEYYVQTTNGSESSFLNGTFSLYVDETSLDIANAVYDQSGEGPFTFSKNPSYYWNPTFGTLQGTEIVTVNILGRTDAPSIPPVKINGQKQRIARVKIPITDPCGVSNITWRDAPMTFRNWYKQQLLTQTDLVTPAKDFPLCEKPSQPTLAVNGSNVICPGDQRLLTTNYAGEHVWYKDGVEIIGQTTNSLSVTEPGQYTAVAVNCLCKSDQSSSFSLKYANPPAKPEITASETALTTSAAGTLQWFFEGAPIPNATNATFEPTQNGEYTLEVVGDCGSSMSDPIEWNKTFTGITDDVLKDVAFNVYPNPYQSHTTISYTLNQTADVSLAVFDLTGKRIVDLVNAEQTAGEYAFRFGDQDEVAAGTYMLRIIVDGQIASMKLVELR